MRSAWRFVFEICLELLELGAEVGNFARCGFIDIVGLLPHQPAHVARRDGFLAVDLLRDGFCARVKRVEHHGVLDALVLFLVVVSVLQKQWVGSSTSTLDSLEETSQDLEASRVQGGVVDARADSGRVTLFAGGVRAVVGRVEFSHLLVVLGEGINLLVSVLSVWGQLNFYAWVTG